MQIKLSSFAFIFVFFVYSIASFPGQFIGSGNAIILLTVLTFFPIYIVNYSALRNKGTLYALFFEVCMLVLLMVESIVYPEYDDEIYRTIGSMAMIGSVGMITATLRFNMDLCFKYGTICAILGAVSAMLILVFSQNDLFFLSMRFGYALLPSVLWFLMLAIKDKSKKALCLFLLTFIPLFIWGSRGTIVVILMFLFIYFLMFKKKYLWLFLPFVLFLMLIDVQALLWDAIVWLQDLTGSRKLGSYSKIIFNEEEARDSIYAYCVEKMKNNSFGYGVGWWKYDDGTGELYPHNIILQIGTEFGIFGLLFLLFILIKSIVVIGSCKKELSILYIFFFSISIGRLLVSSSYWDRPEFWFVIGLFLFSDYRKIPI